MFKRFMLFAGLFVLILAASPIAAQFETPLIVLYGGGLWTADESFDNLIPFETCPMTADEPLVSHYSGSLALSPDGTQLAYNIQPTFVTEAIERSGGIGGGELPSNIVLCDLETGEITTIAGQPENAALFDPAGNPDANTMHSLPEWSPDGSQLAWTQFSYPDVDGGGLAVMLYDLASGETSQIAGIPPQFGVPVTIPLDWSDAGILVRNQTFVPPSEGADPMITPVNDTLDILDPSTGTLQTIYTFNYEGLDAPYPQDYFWVETADGWQVALLNSINEWQIINPATGSTAPLDGILAYTIPGTRSRVGALITQDLGGMYYQWVDISEPDRQPVAIGYETNGRLIPPALSVPTAQYAFPNMDNSAIAIIPGYRQQPIPLPVTENPAYDVEVVWSGGAEWQLLKTEDVPGMSLFYPTLPLSLLATGCPGFMPSKLVIGEEGIVIDDEANNVRSAPTTSGDVIGELPSGSTFTVLAGPVCSEDLAWWFIGADDLSGWTAEGMGSDYWLSPVEEEG